MKDRSPDTLAPSAVDVAAPQTARRHHAFDLPRRQQLLRWSRPGAWLPPAAAFGLLALGWQIYAEHNRFIIPTVPQIFASLTSHPGLYWRNLLVTLTEAVTGAAGGMLTAFVLAVVMCQARIVARALMPLAVVLNVTPVVAVAPGLVAAFGFGPTPKYIVTAVIVFFPFLINCLTGLRSYDPQVHDVLTTLHATRWEILVRLRIPGSLPYVFAAARICLPLSVVGAVVAEFTAAGQQAGLGSLIETAASLSDLKTVYASVLMLAFLGIALTSGAVLLQRLLLRWDQPSSRESGEQRR